MPVDTAYSVCPHDCPSACALEVERLDGRRIGRVRGSSRQSYTRGVVCAKVARYAERQHHPARLSHPLRRVGERGFGAAAFMPISWDEALDEVAERLTCAAQRHGAETVWPYYYAGTMGLVQRDGINRLRHAMGYSRERLSICSMLSDAGWLAGVGVKRGVDGREIAEIDAGRSALPRAAGHSVTALAILVEKIAPEIVVSQRRSLRRACAPSAMRRGCLPPSPEDIGRR